MNHFLKIADGQYINVSNVADVEIITYEDKRVLYVSYSANTSTAVYDEETISRVLAYFESISQDLTREAGMVE